MYKNESRNETRSWDHAITDLENAFYEIQRIVEELREELDQTRDSLNKGSS